MAYAVELVIGQLMGFPYHMVKDQPSEEDPHILIIPHPAPSLEALHDSGFLAHSGLETPQIRLVENGDSGLSFDDSGRPDLLASVFWLVTEYAGWGNADKDEHGRWRETAIHTHLNLASRPIVHDWVLERKKALLAKWPELTQLQRNFSLPHEIVIDIDQPWKYLHKPWWVQAGGLIKALLSFRKEQIRERIRAWRTGEDPNDTIEELMKSCDPETTSFFVLGGTNHPNDSRFPFQHQAWRDKIREIASRGFRVNIHPSYLSSETEGMIEAELKDLQAICQSSAQVRMHFLRYTLPGTRREMIATGITKDYSLYRNGEGGFPCGMMQPFRWYDLEEEAETDLWIVPTTLMDRTLVGTAASPSVFSPEKGMAHSLRLLETIIEGNGAFVLCLHNECLSDSEEWKGWEKWARQMISILNQENSLGRS